MIWDSQPSAAPPPSVQSGWLDGLRMNLLELARDTAVQQFGSTAYFAWRNEVRLRLSRLMQPNLEWREVVLREFDMLSIPSIQQEWPLRLTMLGNYLAGLLFMLGRLGPDLEFNEASVHKPRLGFHPPEIQPASGGTSLGTGAPRVTGERKDL